MFEMWIVLQHLAGHEVGDQNESWSGPDPDPNKAITVHKHSCLSRKVEKVKGTCNIFFSLLASFEKVKIETAQKKKKKKNNNNNNE